MAWTAGGDSVCQPLNPPKCPRHHVHIWLHAQAAHDATPCNLEDLLSSSPYLDAGWHVDGIGGSAGCSECCLGFRQVPECVVSPHLQQVHIYQEQLVVQLLYLCACGP